MEVTREHREAIITGTNADMLMDISIKNGMTTLGDECRDLVIKGMTTIAELATITLIKEV
jgi:type IV pilus assembly protein PilB